MHSVVRNLSAVLAMASLNLTATELDSLVQPTSLTGVARARHEVTLRPPMDSEIKHIAIHEGQRIAKDGILLELNNTVQQARVRLAEAAAKKQGELQRAKAEQRLAELKHKHTQKAHAQSAAPQWELNLARYEMEKAKAYVQDARDRQEIEKLRLATERAVLEQFTIRAPFEGIMVELYQDVGASVKRSDKLLTLADLSELELVLYLPDSFRNRIKENGRYRLKAIDPAGLETTGILKFIDPRVDAASGLLKTIFTIDNNTLTIAPGSQFQLDLKTEEIEGLSKSLSTDSKPQS